MADRRRLGPTGTHPEGKLNADDKGGLTFAVYDQRGRVVLDFCAQVAWVGMSPETARKMAEMLTNVADFIDQSQPTH